MLLKVGNIYINAPMHTYEYTYTPMHLNICTHTPNYTLKHIVHTYTFAGGRR